MTAASGTLRPPLLLRLTTEEWIGQRRADYFTRASQFLVHWGLLMPRSWLVNSLDCLLLRIPVLRLGPPAAFGLRSCDRGRYLPRGTFIVGGASSAWGLGWEASEGILVALITFLTIFSSFCDNFSGKQLLSCPLCLVHRCGRQFNQSLIRFSCRGAVDSALRGVSLFAQSCRL